MVVDEQIQVKGILPLTIIKSFVFGKFAVSTPFCNYGGICADNLVIENILLEKAKEIIIEQNLKHLELRHYSPHNLNLSMNDDYVTSVLELYNTSEVLYERLPKNKRHTIRKSQKRDLSYKWDNAQVKEFFLIYSCNMRKLGSPTHSLSFFESIISSFPDNVKLLTVYLHTKPIYSSFLFCFKNTIYSLWSSALQDYRKYYPTDFGIWEAIKFGCKNGFKHYDFGRSQPNSANLEFKQRWGAIHRTLSYQYYLNNSESVNNYHVGSKEKIFISIWKKVPLLLTRVIGPNIRKKIP